MEDFVPCPEGSFLGVEGKLGVRIFKISYQCNRLCVTLTLSGVYINRSQGCQNRDSIKRFYDFTIHTNPSDSTILVHRIYVSTILIVKILRFAILPSELRSDSKSRF